MSIGEGNVANVKMLPMSIPVSNLGLSGWQIAFAGSVPTNSTRFYTFSTVKLLLLGMSPQLFNFSTFQLARAARVSDYPKKILIFHLANLIML